MIGRQIVLILVASLGLVAVVLSAGLLPLNSTARALPTAGTDILNVSGSTSIISVLGTETIALTGTVTIERSDPRIEGGVEVVDTEIVAMDLTGTSVTGPITVVENATLVSSGEIRSLQPPPVDFPASSFFDAFIEVAVPGSPSDPLILHNEEPFRLVPTSGGSEVPLTAWPPTDVTYQDEPEPCIPLLPGPPAQVCVTSLSIVLGDVKPTPTVTPTPSNTPTPTVTPTPCPTGKVPADGGCGTPTATPTPTPTPIPPPNDDFADAELVAALPSTDHEDTSLATLEAGEPQPCAGINRTVWYSLTPGTDVTLVADTVGSNYDTALAVYTGTSLETLSTVVCNDDFFGLLSRVQVSASAGVTYYFQVGGFVGSSGHLDFNLALAPPTPTHTPTPCPTAKVPVGGGCGTPTPVPTPTPKPPDGDTDGDTIPNSSDPDDDNDGCTDVAELEPKAGAAAGGGRDPHDYWDFMDMWVNGQKDRRVNIVDITAIVKRFGAVGDPGGDPLDPPQALTGYHVSADRSSPEPGANAWNAGPPDGTINILEIVAAVIQFGHTCA